MEHTKETMGTENLKTLAWGIGEQAALASLQQVSTDDGYRIAEQVWEDSSFQYEDIVRKDLESGKLAGLKAASAAAIKVAAEKKLINSIPAGTAASACADISHIGVESTKTLYDVAQGRCTPREGMERMADVTTATMTRSWTKKGMAIGAGIGSKVGGAIGSIFGPAGTAIGAKVGGVVGGLVGAAVGAFAGSNVGKAIGTAVTKVLSVAKEAVKTAVSKLKEGAKKVVGWFKKKLFG